MKRNLYILETRVKRLKSSVFKLINMIFNIAVVGVTLLSLSPADSESVMVNVMIWDEMAQFYHNFAGPDVNPLNDMSDDLLSELCSTVGNAPQFLVTAGNTDLDIVQGGVASAHLGNPIQSTIVLINGSAYGRTIMLCELQNDNTFYLGRSLNLNVYFLFATSDTRERPKLRAIVQIVEYLELQYFDGTRTPHSENFQPGIILEAETAFCAMQKHEMLNFCASVHRFIMQYNDNGKIYNLELESGSNNHCSGMSLTTKDYTLNMTEEQIIPIATCHVSANNDDNQLITYRFTPHPSYFPRIVLLAQPDESRMGSVHITGKILRWNKI